MREGAKSYAKLFRHLYSPITAPSALRGPQRSDRKAFLSRVRNRKPANLAGSGSPTQLFREISHGQSPPYPAPDRHTQTRKVRSRGPRHGTPRIRHPDPAFRPSTILRARPEQRAASVDEHRRRRHDAIGRCQDARPTTSDNVPERKFVPFHTHSRYLKE